MNIYRVRSTKVRFQNITSINKWEFILRNPYPFICSCLPFPWKSHSKMASPTLTRPRLSGVKATCWIWSEWPIKTCTNQTMIQSCQLVTVHLISVVTEKAEVGDASELWVYFCLGTYNQAMSTSMPIGKSWSNLYNTFSPAVHVLLLGFPFLVPCTARYFSFEHVQRWPFQCRPWESLSSNLSSEFTN